MKTVSAVGILLAAFVVAGCTATAPASTPHSHEMSRKEAAAKYEAIMKPLDKAIDNMNAAGDDSWAEFQYYAPGTAAAFRKANAQLGSPSSWPTDVQHSVGILKVALAAWAATDENYATATSAAAGDKVAKPSDKTDGDEDAAAAHIRHALGLGAGPGEL
jgi:hypothetical protein